MLAWWTLITGFVVAVGLALFGLALEFARRSEWAQIALAASGASLVVLSGVTFGIFYSLAHSDG